jgi:ubiquinone/menaquinone biosynthesis C-methylase UbiE
VESANQPTNEQNADEFYAQTYDDSVPDWPGEIDFYGALAAKVKSNAGTVLEIACGTGRVAIRLAQYGVNVVGLDLAPEMIDVVTQKSTGLGNVRWVQGDMRSFRLQ